MGVEGCGKGVRWGRGAQKGLLLGNQRLDPASPRDGLCSSACTRWAVWSGSSVCVCAGGGCPRTIASICWILTPLPVTAPQGGLGFSFVLQQSRAPQLFYKGSRWRTEMYRFLRPCQERSSLAACATQGYTLWTISSFSKPLNELLITCTVIIMLSVSNLYLHVYLPHHVPLQYSILPVTPRDWKDICLARVVECLTLQRGT